MSVEIHKDDIGTGITIQIKDCDGIVNLTSATIMQIIFLKPNKDKLTVTPTFLTDGTDGKIRYITESGDLDVVGMWSYQCYIELSDGKWFSDRGTFRVFPNI